MDKDESRDPINAFIQREPMASALFGVAALLIVLLLTGGALFRLHGDLRLLEAALAATAVFSMVGAGVGLVRGLRSRPIRGR